MADLRAFLDWWFDGTVESVVVAMIAVFLLWKALVYLLPDWLCGPGGVWIDTSIECGGDGEGCDGGDGGGD